MLCFIDIDECADEGSNDCSHSCINSVGSFYCECDSGFALQEDGNTCTGILYSIACFYFHSNETL